MHTFRCQCGNPLYFENTQCCACGRTVGYLPERGTLTALESRGDGTWSPSHAGPDEAPYRRCRNYEIESVCNWMVPAAENNAFCRACQLNRIIPDLNEPRNRVLWYRVEVAKRRLLYTLYGLGLPVVGKHDDPEHGLAFEFLADPATDSEFLDDAGERRRILTGHSGGFITINISEADPSARESMREKMNELYRTLLGHFRHESGHYFWDRLIRDTDRLDSFRALFGDERSDYRAALERYYNGGAGADRTGSYISAYATAHPWEDWAETWAHYLHMVDTLETAHDTGVAVHGHGLESLPRDADAAAFRRFLSDWGRLSTSMNLLSRSMGLPDAYPFVVRNGAIEKLRFVHDVIAAASR